MLLKQETLAGIAEGRITVAFRRWRRPTVRAGGTLLTAVGQLAIGSVEIVEPEHLTDADAVAAGFEDLDALVVFLASRDGGDIYRVGLSRAGPDPRVALRSELPGPDELADIRGRLERWDRASRVGPWTRRALELIAAHPGRLAAKLAAEAGLETGRFKTNVRQLKGLGLTESLEIGYRLSPRGEAVLGSLADEGGRGGAAT